MALRRTLIGVAVVLALFVVGSEPFARGQARFPRGMPLPQAKPAEFQDSGTIEDLGLGWLVMKSDGDQLRLVQFTPNTRVQVSGKATAEFLGTGQWISFVAEVDKRRGMVVEKVSRLTIFTPTAKKQPGAYPDQGFGMPSGPGFGGEGKQRDAAKGPFGGGAERGPGGFGPEPGSGGGRGGGRKAAAGAIGGKTLTSATQSFEVRGQITAIKNGRMTLRVPTEYFKPSLKVELADEPDIDLELVGLDRLGLAQKGDKVSVRGQQLGEKALAAEIEVTVVEPLGAGQAKKKPVAKGERAGRSSRRGDAPPAAGLESGKDEEKSPPKKGLRRPAKQEAREPVEKPAEPAAKEAEK